MDPVNVGKAVKAHYPQYQNMDDAAVGSAYLAKYGGGQSSSPPSTPAATTTPVNSSPPANQTMNSSIGKFLLDLGASATKPLRVAGEGVIDLARSGAYGVAKATGNKKADEILIKQKPVLLSKDEKSKEVQAIKDNPAKATAQEAAGLASYVVPFGKGASLATKVLLPGAAAGGLAASSETDATLPDIIGGTATGAVGAGVLHGVSKIPSMVGKAGEVVEGVGTNLRKGSTKIELPPSVYGADREKAVRKTLDTLGIKGTPAQKYEQLQPKMDQLGQYIQSDLQQNPKMIKLDDVVSDFDKNLNNAGLYRRGEMTKSNAQTAIRQYIQDLYHKASGSTSEVVPSEISNADLFALKQDINSDFKSVKTKIDNGVPLNDQDRVISIARQTVDDIISSTNPNVKKATVMQSHLYDSVDSLHKARNSGEGLQLPLGAKVPAEAIQFVQDHVGSTIQGVGNKMQGMDVLPDLSPQLVGQVGSRAGAVFGGQQGTNPPNNPDTNTYNEQPSSNMESQTNHGASIPQSGLTREQAQQMLMKDAVLTGGRNADTIEKMYNIANPADVRNAMVDIKTAGNIVDQIEKSLNAIGGGSGRLGGKIKQFQGNAGSDAKVTAYENLRQASILPLAKIISGQSGNGVSDMDVKRAEGLLPDVTNTPEESQRMLSQLKQLLSAKQAAILQSSGSLPDITGGQ